MTAESLGDDPRYDRARWFEALSAIRLPDACDRIIVRFGLRYGLPGFEIDCEQDGDEVSVWTESRADALALYVTIRDRFHTPEELAGGVKPGNPHSWRIRFRWSSRLVSWEEERTIWAAVAEVFECPPVALPAAVRRRTGRVGGDLFVVESLRQTPFRFRGLFLTSRPTRSGDCLPPHASLVARC